MDALVETLAPYAAFLAELDLARPEAAAAALEQRFPHRSQMALRTAVLDAHAAGKLTPKQAGDGIRFGRVCKAIEATAMHSVDAVDIEGAGAEHTHPRGEVSFCIALDGTPRFDGYTEGWVVLGVGSHHAPTVTGGRMLILYFLPGGEVRWGPKAA